MSTVESIKKNKIFSGTVVRKSSDKTVCVEIVTYKMHEKYRKKYKSTKRYLVHDEKNACSLGDTVHFQVGKPISKQKSFYIV